MKSILFIVSCLVLSAVAAPLLYSQSATRIPGEYIVAFFENVTDDAINQHLMAIDFTDENSFVSSWSMGQFKAYGAVLSKATLEKELNSPIVKYIEANQVFTLVAEKVCTSETSTASWGLDRINQRPVNLDGIYNYNSVGAGAGVDAYIVDTGVYAAHNDFQPGRATQAVNFVDGANDDCNGHGTHVAGTVGGNLYGVAKEVNIIGVKVLNCKGSGTTIGVLDGVNYVRTSAQASRRPSVANMSLGGGASSSLDSAVASAVSAGVAFAVAAGNENQDACNVSPAREPSAITTGATVVADEAGVQVDTRSSYSNFGTCVSIFAPGSLITSAWIGSPSATNTISGTSMASPHVAGAAAVYLSLNPGASPATVKSALVSSATSDVISLKCLKRGCSDSPNKLLYSAC